MANIVAPLVQEFPQPPATAVEDDGPDWEPGPDQCATIWSVLDDGVPWTSTFLDLFSPDEREALLRDLPPKR